MKVILCLEEKLGYCFLGKRLSQDQNLRQNLKQLLHSEKVYMNAYSYVLYKDYFADALVDEHFLDKAKDHYVVIENVSLSSYQDQIDEYVIYEWNRSYPATLFFSSTWLSSFELVETMEFSGTSHEKITRRIYRKESSYETER